MAETPTASIIIEDGKTQTYQEAIEAYQEAIEAFQERVAASTAHALGFSSDTSIKGFCYMVGRIAREHWIEVKSEYAVLKTKVD